MEFYRELVDARLDELLPMVELVPQELHSAMRYSALAPGKRLRPALCMASSAAAGGDWKLGLDAGCGIELIHCFSLIHDDLPAIDNDDLRRGRKTCHVEYGEALAILAGDALFALAFEIAASSSSNLEINSKVVKALAEASGSRGLVGGEVLDILAEGSGGDLGLLQMIHARKTGSLIGACCEIGALLTGVEESLSKKFCSFGEKVGLAFQIADDVLNETSTPEQLGKATGSDRELEKLTYPALVGLEESKRMANHCLELAMDSIADIGSEADGLRDLASYAVTRTW